MASRVVTVASRVVTVVSRVVRARVTTTTTTTSRADTAVVAIRRVTDAITTCTCHTDISLDCIDGACVCKMHHTDMPEHVQSVTCLLL